MPHSIRMLNCVPAGQVTTKTVPKKYEFFQTNSLPPFLNVINKLLMTFLGEPISRSEVDSSASGESWEVDGIEFSVGVEVVKILVELWNATAETMNHDKGNSRFLIN